MEQGLKDSASQDWTAVQVVSSVGIVNWSHCLVSKWLVPLSVWLQLMTESEFTWYEPGGNDLKEVDIDRSFVFVLVNTWLFGSQSYRETITVNLTILLLILVSATVKQKIRRFWTFGTYYFVLFFIQDRTQLRIHSLRHTAEDRSFPKTFIHT